MKNCRKEDCSDEKMSVNFEPHADLSAAISNSQTVCGICGGTCGINLTLENGTIVAVEGDEGHPVSKGHLCPKGRAFPESLRSPDRLKQPLRKTDQGRWEAISWDQAFDLLAFKLSTIRAAHGAESVAIHVGQAGVGKEFFPYVERFCNLFGSPNFSTSGSHCHESKSMANVLTYGALPIADYEHAKCIVLWGKNPLTSTPSLVSDLKESRARGCRLLVVDPRETPLARQADLHLQLRPGTDGALALGLLHVIIKEALYDREFVRKWVTGFDQLAAHVAAYSPQKVEQITWIPAAKIRLAARLYASSSPASISPGVALELHANGFQATRAIAILQAITGNLDVSGGALFLTEAQLSDMSVANQSRSAKPAIGQNEYPLFHKSTGHAQAHLYADAILEGRPYPIKALVIVGSNPALTWPNARRVIDAFAKLEFLAVMDPFMTKTAKLAHLVLPSATFLGRNELWDSSHLSREPRLGLAPKMCDEEGLLTNWEVWKELATRMGYAENFPWKDEEEAINYRLKPLGLTVDDLRGMPGGYVYHRWAEKKYEQNGFKTSSGKVEVYSKELERYGYDPLPTYVEPGESPLSAPGKASAYPLVLTTGARTLEYIHSRFRNVPSLHRRVPEPHVEVHPAKAEELGVEEGEMVAVESPRGRVEMRVRYTDEIDPRVIFIPHGWNDANANILTDDRMLDPVTGFPPARSLLARIVKK
jgi:anaerobic selenocysteine-containing dehydrogenase